MPAHATQNKVAGKGDKVTNEVPVKMREIKSRRITLPYAFTLRTTTVTFMFVTISTNTCKTSSHTNTAPRLAPSYPSNQNLNMKCQLTDEIS